MFSSYCHRGLGNQRRGLLFSLSLLAILVLWVPTVALAQETLYVLTVPEDDVSLEKASDEISLASELVHWGLEITPSVVARGPAQIRLELPNGEVVTAHRDFFEQRENGAFWRGHLPKSGFSGSAVQLTLHDGLVVGNMHTHEGRFRIAPTAAGGHRLLQLEANEAACAAHAPPSLDSPERVLLPPAFGPAEDRDLRIEQYAGATIDVIAYYTSTAASRWGGDAQAKANIQGAVDYQNTVFANSQIEARTRLLFTGAAPPLNVNDGDGLLPEFRVNSEVIAKRNSTKADLVHLFVGQPAGNLGYCGIAYLLTRGENATSFSPFAYGVTTNGRGCSSYEEVFSHEQGHNMGANHDPQNASINPGDAVAPYAFGHSIPDTQKDSIMVYGQFEVVPYYSNPDVELEGRAIGITGERDNAQALRGTVKMVGNYSGALSGGGGGGGGGGNNNGPTAPSNLSATPNGSFVTLMWTDNADDETSFHVESREAGGSFSEIASLPANSTFYDVTDLQAGKSYDFRVRAKGAEGFGKYSNTASLTTSILPAPTDVTAVPMSNSSVEIAWQGVPGGVDVTVEMTSPTALYSVAGSADGAAGSLLVIGLDGETPYTFKVYSSSSVASSTPVEVSATTRGASGACRSGSRYLCLLDDRFEVFSEWKKPVAPFENGVGTAGTIPGSDKTGTFWFFNNQNVELLLKMLDGRPINDSFWHFYGALSDVEYWVTVRDTSDDTTVTYHNNPGNICGVNDTGAFLETPDVAGAPDFKVGPGQGSNGSVMAEFPATDTLDRPTFFNKAGTCVASDTVVCLRNDRFEIEVDFIDPRDGSEGKGRSLPAIQTNDTGFVWFFDSSNVELAIKVLDGTPLNGKFWVFYGALSDVEYTITVTDTETGAEATYSNPRGSICGVNDTSAL